MKAADSAQGKLNGRATAHLELPRESIGVHDLEMLGAMQRISSNKSLLQLPRVHVGDRPREKLQHPVRFMLKSLENRAFQEAHHVVECGIDGSPD